MKCRYSRYAACFGQHKNEHFKLGIKSCLQFFIACSIGELAFCRNFFFSSLTIIYLPGHVGTTNNVLTLSVVNVSSPAGAQLQCTFLSGFTGSAHCEIQYGTDPTYMNLPYSSESTETGTVGDTVSVVLRDRLNSSTVYYYTVSAVSGDVTVTVRGTFITPEYSKWYMSYIRKVLKCKIETGFCRVKLFYCSLVMPFTVNG